MKIRKADFGTKPVTTQIVLSFQEAWNDVFSKIENILRHYTTAEDTIDLVARDVSIIFLNDWIQLLCTAFPGFGWQENESEKDGFKEEYWKFVFERFFHELNDYVLTDLKSKKSEIAMLKVEIWKVIAKRKRLLIP